MWYRRNVDVDLRSLERQAKATGLPEDIKAYAKALRRSGASLCNCESQVCGHEYPCLERANLDTSTPVGAVCDACAAVIPSEFHNADCWCRACGKKRVGNGLRMKTNGSIDDIKKLGSIPQFEGLQGPNMHWFGESYNPSLEHEKWHEWYVVSMSLRAYYTAILLGLSILPLSQQGFPVDPLNASADILMAEFEEWARNRERPPHFIIKTKDILPLARYFALASRRNHRGRGDYGVLEPGWGWGEYRDPRSQKTVWIAQPEFLPDKHLAIIKKDFIELKAPDTGSISTGKLDLDRDLEWLIYT